MEKATINSKTFSYIFKNQEELLAKLAAALTRNDYKVFLNNITSDILNPKKLEYIIKMPDDNTIKIINTKNNKKIIYKLKK